MISPALSFADTGLEVNNLRENAVFASRRKHVRDMASQMRAMKRIARAFLETPETILQQLVDSAIDLCGADSAGISIEKPDRNEQHFYEWVAIGGQYSQFLNAILPQYPSACGICLERGTPQHFRVDQRFFDLMGIDAPLITDGLLLPWHVDDTRGTIFIMAHGRTEAFDLNDCALMTMLADFATLGVAQQRRHKIQVEQAVAAASASLANSLAHRINNPLQALTNLLYLAAEGFHGEQARSLGREASADLAKLSSLVTKLLVIPYREAS